MTSTTCPEDALTATAEEPAVVRQESAPGLPAGSWIRVIHELPCETRPEDQILFPARKLTIGCRVFIDLREGSLRVRGWGLVKRLPEPLGWHVEFEDGSAVGMPRNELKKHCLIADKPAAGWRRFLKGKPCRSPQRSHRASPVAK